MFRFTPVCRCSYSSVVPLEELLRCYCGVVQIRGQRQAVPWPGLRSHHPLVLLRKHVRTAVAVGGDKRANKKNRHRHRPRRALVAGGHNENNNRRGRGGAGGEGGRHKLLVCVCSSLVAYTPVRNTHARTQCTLATTQLWGEPGGARNSRRGEVPKGVLQQSTAAVVDTLDDKGSELYER